MSWIDEQRKKAGLLSLNSTSKPIENNSSSSTWLEEQKKKAFSNAATTTQTPAIIPEVAQTNTNNAKKYNTGIGWLDTVGNALDTFNQNTFVKGLNTLGLGLEKGTGLSITNKLLNPEIEAKNEEIRKANPITSTIGEVAGYAIPFGIAGKAIAKLPVFANPASTALGRIGQATAKTGLEGLTVTPLMSGASNAIDYARGKITGANAFTNTAKDTALNTLGGALFGAGGKAIGEGFSKLKLNNQLKNIDNVYSNMINNGITYNPTIKPMNTTNTNVALKGFPDTESRIVSTQKDNNDSLFKKAANKWNDFYQNWVDNVSSINKFSKDAKDKTAYIKATNAKKVNSTVSYILNNGLVDREGNVIGESFSNIIKDIPKDKEKTFLDYLLHRHNVARVNQDKPIFSDYSSLSSDAKATALEQANPEFKVLRDRIYKFINDFSDIWMKDSGLTSDALLNELRKKYPNYIPTQREFSELEKGISGGAKSGYVDQSNQIKKATGSDRDVLNPLENIMNLVNRTVRNARRNEVGQEIAKAIAKNPQELSKYAEILPPDYNGRLDLNNIVTVRFNGEPIHLKINDKRFLDTITEATNATDGKGLETVNKLFKGLITQYNPIFALRNIARDIPTAYIYGSEKNPIKFTRDLIKAGKDILTRGKDYERYKALGGGESNFFSPDNVTMAKEQLINPSKWYKNPVKSTINAIGKFNNFTETLPRLSEFQRTLRKGGTAQEALYNAGEISVNFARGGNKAKQLDKKWVPYLNASIQGLDRFARGIKDNPIGFAGKALTAVTVPTVISEISSRTVDPEGYANLDNRTKDAYFVFPKGNGEFIKIPKSRETSVLFSSLFQRMYRQINGEEGAWKGFDNTIATNFSPTNPIENNILAPLFLNIPKNKDFADRDIVPANMKDLSPRLQYDDKTSEIAKKIGDITNLSPKQIDYIIKSYSGVIGQMLLPYNTKDGTPSKALTNQFIADSVYSNKQTKDFYDNYDKLKTLAADRNAINKLPPKVVTPEERARNIFAEQAKRMNLIRNSVKDGTEEEKRNAQKIINEISKQMNQNMKYFNSN